jgi:hypothetical protein
MDAIDASAEALHWILATQLAIGGAGDEGGCWFDFFIASAERWAV